MRIGRRIASVLCCLAGVGIVVVASCYSPNARDCKYTCGPNESCPAGLTCHDTFCRTPDDLTISCKDILPPPIDAAQFEDGKLVVDAPDAAPRPDAAIDAPGTTCSAAGIVTASGFTVPSGSPGDMTVNNAPIPYDTSNCPGGSVQSASNVNACVVKWNRLIVTPNTTWFIRGQNPLVIFAETVDIQTMAHIKVEAGSFDCGTGGPGAGTGNSGGGGGGFGGSGGRGGSAGGAGGGTAGPNVPSYSGSPFRGGCNGADGGGPATGQTGLGLGGGAIEIVAKSIMLGNAATIEAPGHTGTSTMMFNQGGGGGGAGGVVLLEACTVTMAAGSKLCATGGGGGAGLGSSVNVGMDMPGTCLGGGSGVTGTMGASGGSGGASTTSPAMPGGNGSAQGGGGGGSYGYTIIRTVDTSGMYPGLPPTTVKSL